jgi:hypothetical protein
VQSRKIELRTPAHEVIQGDNAGVFSAALQSHRETRPDKSGPAYNKKRRHLANSEELEDALEAAAASSA